MILIVRTIIDVPLSISNFTKGGNIFPSLEIKICIGIMERRTNFAPGRKCTRLFPLERRGERKSKETRNKENFKRANVHGKFLENRRFASAT